MSRGGMRMWLGARSVRVRRDVGDSWPGQREGEREGERGEERGREGEGGEERGEREW
jgi:hypothetical protein